jgi:outer membrane protein assembly factor BamD
VDRDPEETRLAVESFQRVVQSYPDSEYKQRALKQIFECQKRIVAHEFNVGRFYYLQGKYSSSKKRLELVSKSYPQAISDLGYQKSIDKMIADCDRHIAKGDEKPSVWTRWGF